MAKRKPKLGDVRYRAACSPMFVIEARLGKRWVRIFTAYSKSEASLTACDIQGILRSIVREARDNGVNDAIAAVQKIRSVGKWVSLPEVVEAIREATGMKECRN